MSKKFISPFFTHDYNARGDEKIVKMLSKQGWAGYGLFWAIVEKIHESGGELKKDYESIAYDLRTQCDCIKTIVEDYDLFYIMNNKIRSYSADVRIGIAMQKSKKAQNAALIRWGNNADALPKQCKSNAITLHNIKQNNIKLNKTKEKKQTSTSVVADKSDNKVNWDICNSNIQIIMKFWVSTYLPHLYREYTNGEYKEFVSTHGKAIAGILKSCRNNASVACKVIKMAAKNFNDSGIENWGLYAVKRGAGDYFNEIKLKEKTKNGNRN